MEQCYVFHLMFKLHATAEGIVIEKQGSFFLPGTPLGWDSLFAQPDPAAAVAAALERSSAVAEPSRRRSPLQSQEVWAAGVTYFRSRTARMEESKDSGGGSFYDKVYRAERPELFLKATPHRVAAPGEPVRIRQDSRWNVPEPELTLAINSQGRIFGYTVGNDMSSRDIEGENPLYLPQAKVYDRSAALGPCLLVGEVPPATTEIAMEIRRAGATAFAGRTALSEIKRSFADLAAYLFRDNAFPHGCYLMTGTGIVPPDEFSLRSGDEIHITIAPIGTLVNSVA
jgi:2-dehydro-3-deoxy-D-arabinonate dehydratase